MTVSTLTYDLDSSKSLSWFQRNLFLNYLKKSHSHLVDSRLTVGAIGQVPSIQIANIYAITTAELDSSANANGSRLGYHPSVDVKICINRLICSFSFFYAYWTSYTVLVFVCGPKSNTRPDDQTLSGTRVHRRRLPF